MKHKGYLYLRLYLRFESRKANGVESNSDWGEFWIGIVVKLRVVNCVTLDELFEMYRFEVESIFYEILKHRELIRSISGILLGFNRFMILWWDENNRE